MHAIVRAAILAIAFAAPMAPAAAAGFHDDFDDGDTLGWLRTTTGGASSYGVEMHNGSLMAFVAHDGAGTSYQSNTSWSSMSVTAPYGGTDQLAFTIHAIATAGRACCGPVDALGGVDVAFLDPFNVEIASVGFYRTTNTALLGTNDHAIDPDQLSYDLPMASFAAYAGIAPGTAIAKLKLTFIGWAEWEAGGNIYPNGAGSTKVWFDNVHIGTVPEPSSALLTLIGAGIVAGRLLRARRAI
jgi:hypothetical protein